MGQLTMATSLAARADVGVRNIRIVKLSRRNGRPIPFGEFPPLPFALRSSDIALVPIEFVFLHHPSQLFGPRPERKACGNVAYSAALHAAETFHIRLSSWSLLSG